MTILSHLRRVHRHNVATLKRDPLAEVSGALGDLGTLLPLMIALAVQGSILIDSTLVFSGVFNVVTGLVFGVPLPVQPMKVSARCLPIARGPRLTPPPPRPSQRPPSRGPRREA